MPEVVLSIASSGKQTGNAKKRSFIFRYLQKKLRACLHGGGGPQVGEVTRLGGVTRLSI